MEPITKHEHVEPIKPNAKHEQIERKYGAVPGKDLMDGRLVKVNEVRDLFIAFEKSLTDLLPDGRRKAIVETTLEEAAMWASKALTHG